MQQDAEEDMSDSGVGGGLFLGSDMAGASQKFAGFFDDDEDEDEDEDNPVEDNQEMEAD